MAPENESAEDGGLALSTIQLAGILLLFQHFHQRRGSTEQFRT